VDTCDPQTPTELSGHGDETRHIWSIYIQPHFLGYLIDLAYSPKTTVTAFHTYFLSTLKRVAEVPAYKIIRELLIALNKIHPLNRIQKDYKSIYTQLAD